MINAGRGTFTTGEVQIENGQVTRYRVEKGAVSLFLAEEWIQAVRIIPTSSLKVKVNAGILGKRIKSNDWEKIRFQLKMTVSK